MNILERTMNGLRAFQKAFLSSDADASPANNFGTFGARRTRYALLWSYYETTAYDWLIHSWASEYIRQYNLYKYVRDIYNPAHRLAEFWTMALMGGALDPAAGDGTLIPSALPIILPKTANDSQAANLRAAVAQLWLDSNWQVNKSIFTRYGTVMGDTALRVVDDVERAKVYLEVVHPSIIKSVDLDPFGNVKAYELEETRAHPTNANTIVKYTERVTRQNQGEASGAPGPVLFETFLNDKPFAWNGVADMWQEEYGFVPFVMVKHLNVGLPWGWSEFHAALPKFRELDDQAALLNDQIRKMVDAQWLFNFKKPSAAPTQETRQPTATNTQRGRDEVKALWIDKENVAAKHLVGDLDIAATLENVNGLLAALREDYPELQPEIFKLGNDASGRALRTVRQPVEAKAYERRTNYDNALVRAQQMALSMGAQKGYTGYESFAAESFTRGELAHSIGKRPVFAVDAFDKIEQDAAFWDLAAKAKAAGVALDVFLELQGWDAERIAKITNNAEFAAKRQMIVDAANAPQNGA
jgi:hypothetical protein